VAVDDAYELAYREAVRALEHQRTALSELRSRAGTLLATASIAISLLGRETSPRLSSWLAIACFALLSVCVLAINWPQAGLKFDLDPQALIDARLSPGGFALADLTVDLVAHMSRQWRVNGRRVARDARVFRIGACLLAIQIVLTIANTYEIV
jgi:hypothetical protein